MLATKFGQDSSVRGQGGSREHLRTALEGSLGRLRPDVIDLYYYHRPDGHTPLTETLGAMQELVDEGTVRYLGLSNVDAAELEEAVSSGVRVVAVQNRYSILHRDDDADVLPFCRQHEIGYVPYFPLESGLLTGKFRRGEPPPEGTRLADRAESLTEERFAAVEALEALAERQGRSLLELAIGGLASIPGDRVGDRRRDRPGAGPRERGGGQLARHRGRARRGRGGRELRASNVMTTRRASLCSI